MYKKWVTRLRSSSEAQRLQRVLQLFDLSPQPLPFIWQSCHIHHRQSSLNKRKKEMGEWTDRQIHIKIDSTR